VGPSVGASSSPSFRFSKNQTIALVFCCSLFGAAAQVLVKTGAATLTGTGIMGMLTNFHVLLGYCLYGLSTITLVLALRDGELSMLYPIISLTFVWVAILSTFFFNEALSTTTILGIGVIVAGVAVLGRGGKK
jgi:uncharacterized membrane protein